MAHAEEPPNDSDTSNGPQAQPTTFTLSTDTPFPLPPKAATAQDASTTPSLPPAMDSVRAHSADEIIQMMKKTPLFMTDLEEGSEGNEGNEENIQLEALRALQYEGSRAEVALGFKERGNEMVAEKRWKDAKEFYTKGILALKAPTKDGEASSRSEEKEQEKNVEEACYINRALCNLELQNFRSTLHDTRHTLLLSPSSPKAHYRSALALLHLSRPSLALDACTRGLALTSPALSSTNTSKRPSPEHAAFLALRDRILAAQRSADAAHQKHISAAERKKKEQLTLNAAIMARGIKVRVTAQPRALELEDAAICLRPDPLALTSVLHFPVLLLYPAHGTSDFVKQVAETEIWGHVLQMVLGGGEEEEEERLPFDERGEYTVEGVESFMETREGGMVKVGRKVRVLDVLAGKGEVVDGVVRVFVVPKGRVRGWVDEMKERRGRG